MVVLIGHMKKNTGFLFDFLYMSALVIASASIATLLLYGMYCWYSTGRLPLAAGITTPFSVSGDSIRFVIGSLLVPTLVAFSIIAVACRIRENSARSLLSQPAPGVPLQMTLRSDSYLFDASPPDTTAAEDRQTTRDSTARAEGENGISQPRVCPGCNTVDTILLDNCIKCGTPLTASRATEKQEVKAAKADESDIIEQLKDPVNREKLVSLLLSSEA
jgi:hypothetical protein